MSYSNFPKLPLNPLEAPSLSPQLTVVSPVEGIRYTRNIKSTIGEQLSFTVLVDILRSLFRSSVTYVFIVTDVRHMIGGKFEI